MKLKQKESSRRQQDGPKGTLTAYGHNFILEFLSLYSKHEEIQIYLDEALHCILFLGYIHKPEHKPWHFFTKEELHQLKKIFPNPFLKYRTHLPHRTPFSILLDAVVKTMGLIHEACAITFDCPIFQAVSINGSRNEQGVLACLANFMGKVQPENSGPRKRNWYTLEATVICICEHKEAGEDYPIKYYGASLSCKGQDTKEIMIALSCLHTWHDYISHAVMSGDEGATVRFPESVKCTAFKRNWEQNVYYKVGPCDKCNGTFLGVSFVPEHKPDGKESVWPRGNCAETECLSKLLKSNPKVCHETRALQNNTPVDIDLDTIKDKARDTLSTLLKGKDCVINRNDFVFYQPSSSAQ